MVPLSHSTSKRHTSSLDHTWALAWAGDWSPTHGGDAEVVLVFALGEVRQLGHPVELLIQLLQQGRGVEHLGLERMKQLVVPLGQPLGQLEGVVQLLAQVSLRGVVGRTVCPKEKGTEA